MSLMGYYGDGGAWKAARDAHFDPEQECDCPECQAVTDDLRSEDIRETREATGR